MADNYKHFPIQKFSEKKPINNQFIGVHTTANTIVWGFYRDSAHHTYPNEVINGNGKRIECFTNSAEWE